MAYEYDSYYIWVDNSVTAAQVKTYCTNNNIPLAAVRFILGELSSVTASGKTLKCTWAAAPTIAGGKVFEADREIVALYGDQFVAAFGGLTKVKWYKHSDAEAYIKAHQGA
jgi:hypothetical protein